MRRPMGVVTWDNGLLEGCLQCAAGGLTPRGEPGPEKAPSGLNFMITARRAPSSAGVRGR